MGAGFHGGFGGTKGSQSNYSMPNHTNATTPRIKYVKYSLDPNNPNAKGKAEAYEKGLGFTKQNAADTPKITTNECHCYIHK